jgi:hypothetical protein
MLGR